MSKKEAEEDFELQRPYNRNSAHVGCNMENSSSNFRVSWNHFSISQTVT
jgi:hypothetical protein